MIYTSTYPSDMSIQFKFSLGNMIKRLSGILFNFANLLLKLVKDSKLKFIGAIKIYL